MSTTITSTQFPMGFSAHGKDVENKAGAPKFQYFNGVRFTRDDKTGYYLNSTLRKRMHRYVGEFYRGQIPKGYDVHHKDHDRANNAIDNLVAMPVGRHRSIHCTEMVYRDMEHTRQHLDSIRGKASIWHGSAAGHVWHKAQYEKVKRELHVEQDYICENCGKPFVSTQINSRFCSNACKSAWRRKSGVDDIERTCVICGSPFIANKYSETQTCGRRCAGVLRWRGR